MKPPYPCGFGERLSIAQIIIPLTSNVNIHLAQHPTGLRQLYLCILLWCMPWKTPLLNLVDVTSTALLVTLLAVFLSGAGLKDVLVTETWHYEEGQVGEKKGSGRSWM